MANDLRAKLKDPGFTPAQREFNALFELLADSDRDIAEHAERALARAGVTAAKRAELRFQTAEPRERARLINVIARVAALVSEPAFIASIERALDDTDPKTRRNAIIALGKLGPPNIESRLLGLWEQAPVEHRRSLAEALGKVGSSRALEFLSNIHSEDQELTRLITRAKLMLSRTQQRESASSIRLDRALSQAMRLVFRCRDGLARILSEEVAALGPNEVKDPGTVRLTFAGTVQELLTIRTALDFGLVLQRLENSASDEANIAQTLASRPVLEALSAWTEGTPRFRLAWPDGGHRRAVVWRIAEAVAQQTSAIVNDPTNASWEILIGETQLLLIPRGYNDPRFAYRKKDVPAASHPTLAAALARACAALPRDVVWDPFVGSALELIERARIGPYRDLLGSDVNRAALEAARENLDSAGVGATLVQADALTYQPAGITLIITNPPMGRRVARDGSLAPLLETFTRHAFDVLVPGGRMVWLSPLGARTAEAGKSAGFQVERHESIDMGGFNAELQILRKRR